MPPRYFGSNEAVDIFERDVGWKLGFCILRVSIGVSPPVLLLGFAFEVVLQVFCRLVFEVVWVLFVALQYTFLTVIVIGAVGVPVGLLGIWSFAHYPWLAPASMQGLYSLQ